MPANAAKRDYAYLLEGGRATRFKKGHNCGPLNPKWKGGKYAPYGISETRYQEILESQSGVCAICLRPPKKNRLCVDHDHKTGAVRGLLCFRCNYGLGWFKDDPGLFGRLSEYIESKKDWRDLNANK